jgi:hypothetical protein
MTSKTTTKAASPRTSRKNSQQPQKKQSLKHSEKNSVKKSNRINRQRRLQKQLQILILERHSRRCIICHHPEREAIEEEFVHWRSPSKLAHDYKLGDYRTIYRHARAAGLLLQRRERLHSALDAFVESVDDVTFTGDTILRAMRAYSCIDSHGRWTEIPTQVQFSTSNGAHPPQPSPRGPHVGSDVIDIDSDEETEDDAEEADNAPEERVTALDVLNVIRKYANQALRSDVTSCAASPAQAANVTSDDYDELDDELDDDPDGDEPDDDAHEESEEEAENALEEFVTSFSASSKSPSPNNAPRSASSEPTSRSDATACSTSSNSMSRSDTTVCAASPVQALPQDVVRGQNPNDRSLSDRTDCAALPAQPGAPPKPRPDADGLIWHPRPGYPNQEISEPDAQGRVRYKIHMTTAAAQLPSRQTDAQRAAELIYGSVIKKYGNP